MYSPDKSSCLLPGMLQSWDYRPVPHYPASFFVFLLFVFVFQWNNPFSPMVLTTKSDFYSEKQFLKSFNAVFPELSPEIILTYCFYKCKETHKHSAIYSFSIFLEFLFSSSFLLYSIVFLCYFFKCDNTLLWLSSLPTRPLPLLPPHLGL